MRTTKNDHVIGNKQRHARDLCVILLFFLLTTGFCRAGLKLIFAAPDAHFYVNTFMQLALYSCLASFSAWHLSLTRQGATQMMGTPTLPTALLAAGLGVVLFCFAVGQEALEAWLLAQFNPELAYSLWSYQPGRISAWDTPDAAFMLHLFVGVIVAPIVEEFFFRGLLFEAFADCLGFHKAALTTGLIFVLAHLEHPHLISTMFFAVALSFLYVGSKSVALCAIAHGVFNLLAFTTENFFFDWLIHYQEEMHLVRAWYPDFALWIASVTIMGCGMYRYRSVCFPQKSQH